MNPTVGFFFPAVKPCVLKGWESQLPVVILTRNILAHRHSLYKSVTSVCQRIDAFERWCWRRLLRETWTARRSNQSIIKEISPEYSLEGLMLKLKLQYVGHLMQRTDSLAKTLMLGKIEGGSRRE